MRKPKRDEIGAKIAEQAIKKMMEKSEMVDKLKKVVKEKKIPPKEQREMIRNAINKNLSSIEQKLGIDPNKTAQDIGVTEKELKEYLTDLFVKILVFE